ncbi:MAG: insulinase family protein [bacterium]
MKIIKRNTLIIFLLFTINAMLFAQSYEIGKTYHGFKLMQKKNVKEVNGECYLFEHSKSGASLLKIAAPDANKTFMIGFKTDPESDAGTPHIMEHSVLNGSKKFPVKSPFDVLSKGSLNTFINAFTGNDHTIYPIASMNDKDYFNLMDVYLDAVFNPLFYNDPRILKQEGWHYELTNKDEPIVYKGVVYNEMKGAYSDPNRELYYQINKNLFPDNLYRFSAGGYPSAIPKLTVEEFKNYHRKYYQPSNSFICLYGDADLDKELKFMNEKYLDNYSLSNSKIEFPLQKSFSKMKEVSAVYSTVEGSSTENQSFLTLNFVAGHGNDQKLVFALYLLSDVLVAQESAPIRKALSEAKIGMDVSGDVSHLLQNIFGIIVQGANPNDDQKFKEIVYNVLNDVVKNGIDKKAVQGVLNRFIFQIRELANPQRGFTFANIAMTGWLYDNNPFCNLEYEGVINELKESINKGYLEEVIKKYMLENNHALLLVLNPKSGLESEQNIQTQNELKSYKETLSQEQIDLLIKENNTLIAYQKEEDTQEALATIPLLDLKDINKKAEYFEAKNIIQNSIKTAFYETFTNNVIYSQLFFDLRVIPQDLIPYAVLLTELLGNLDTKNYSYAELEKVLNINTGGFNTYTSMFIENRDDNNLIPMYVVSSKCINDKTVNMFELNNEIINNTKFEDKERIKYLLSRLQSRYEEDIKSNGFGYTMRRLKSYYSKEGAFDEMTNGIEFYWFISNLNTNIETKYEETISYIKKVANLIFNKNNLFPFVTCAKADLSKYEEGYKILNLENNFRTTNKFVWSFNLERKNEGFLTASKVQYVAQGFNIQKLGYEYTGKLRVFNQIVSRDWLYNRLRVIGGAYGGFGSVSPNGHMLFLSYRDPNLKNTLATYAETTDYIKSFSASNTDMSRYIIGTIAKMDLPLTPLQEGTKALKYLIEKTTAKDIQKERDEVLSTTVDDIRSMEKIVKSMIEQKYYCVYGSEDQIKGNRELFQNVLKIIE